MPGTERGIVHLSSAHAADDVLARLLALLQEKGVTVFAVVDHSGEAARAGFAMPNTKLVIFGNPKVGTPVMLAAPDSALDLPLKILIAAGADGKTYVSYNSPAYLQARYDLNLELVGKIAAVEQIAAAIVG